MRIHDEAMIRVMAKRQQYGGRKGRRAGRRIHALAPESLWRAIGSVWWRVAQVAEATNAIAVELRDRFATVEP